MRVCRVSQTTNLSGEVPLAGSWQQGALRPPAPPAAAAECAPLRRPTRTPAFFLVPPSSVLHCILHPPSSIHHILYSHTQHSVMMYGRGAAKKKIDGPPRAFTKSQTHPPTPPTFFFLAFFFSTFLGVSRQGEFKNTIKMFLQKVHVENFSQNFDNKFRCQFFLDFFLFYRVFGCFSAMGVQKHHQKRFAKKSCRKVFTKNSTKNPKPIFFSILFITFLGVSR
jgi:hypothetical protein